MGADELKKRGLFPNAFYFSFLSSGTKGTEAFFVFFHQFIDGFFYFFWIVDIFEVEASLTSGCLYEHVSKGEDRLCDPSNLCGCILNRGKV